MKKREISMENVNVPAKTEIKYKITSCYFCNEFLDNDNFKLHAEQCGQVLQPCPYKCLSYIPRKYMESHKLECPRLHENSTKKSNENLLKKQESYENDYFILEQSIVSLRSALHEEIRQRHRLIADIGDMRRQNQHSDTWIQRFDDEMIAMKNSIGNESESRCIDVENCQKTIEQLTYQYKEVKEWRKELRLLLDRFSRDLEFRNDVTKNLETLFDYSDSTSLKLKSLEEQIDELKANPKSAAEKNEDSFPESERFAQPIYSNSYKHMIQQQYTCTAHCDLFESKLAKFLLEVKQMKNIVCETEDRCDKMEKTVIEERKISAQTKQALIDLETHMKIQRKMESIASNNGHFLWRIDQYTAKLKEAKENDVVLRSPIFCNEPYGYNLRLDVLLNGSAAWKGRNLLACLTVVDGEYDALLQWPCELRADLIVRDQPTDLSMAKDIVKTIFVKKRNATYEQNQYIFIPHKKIQSQYFLKNDTIFFEVRVKQSNPKTN